MERVPEDLWFDDLSDDERAKIEIAAVLEIFDVEALTALGTTAVAATLAKWIASGRALLSTSGYHLSEPIRRRVLAELSTAPSKLCTLDQRAAGYFAGQLTQATTHTPTIEDRYMHHVQRCCDYLIRNGSSRLVDVVATIPAHLLMRQEHRFLVRYYQGISAGFSDKSEQARDIFKDLLDQRHDLSNELRIRVLNSDAIYARYLSMHEEASEALQESLALAQAIGDQERQALAHMNLGMVYFHLHDYTGADDELRESLDLFTAQENVMRIAHVHANLGLVAAYQGKWSTARDYLLCAANDLIGEDSQDYRGRVMLDLGEVEMLQGRFDAALERFAQAQELMTSEQYRVDLLVDQGLVFEAQGNNEAALAAYIEAAKLALRRRRREIIASIYERIGHVYQRQSQFARTRKYYQKAIRWIESIRKPISHQRLLISLMGRWQSVYEAMILLCLAQKEYHAAFDYSEQARARAFADLLAKHASAKQQQKTPEPITAFETQQQLPAGTLLLYYMTTGVTTPDLPLLNGMPPAAASLRECLSIPSHIVWFSLTHEHIAADLCTTSPETFALPSTSEDRRAHSEDYRVRLPGFLRFAYHALLAPIDHELEDAPKLVIVPHGPLHTIPFAALTDTQNLPLIDRVSSLSYTPSATIFFRSHAQRSTETLKPCLVLGYDGSSKYRLRHAVAEAEAIAQLCNGVVWQEISQAGLPLSEVAGDYRVLHFACHGYFNLADPLQSWLEIGPDQQLTATNILLHFRLQAVLVSLGACESGVNRVLSGDEPLGLVRAFLSAGSQAVLVTRWPVEDRSARLLMEHFYRVLNTEQTVYDPAAALKAAQQYLRKLRRSDIRNWFRSKGDALDSENLDDDDLRFDEPRFWAAYQIVSVAPSASIST